MNFISIFILLLRSQVQSFSVLSIKWDVGSRFRRTYWVKSELRMLPSLRVLGSPWDVLQKNVPLLKLLIQKLNPYWYMETDSYSYVPYDL